MNDPKDPTQLPPGDLSDAARIPETPSDFNDDAEDADDDDLTTDDDEDDGDFE